jgi:hypothetical protein
MASFEEIAGEYRIAYQQLVRAEEQSRQLAEQMEREYRLHRKRYEMARAAYVALALGEGEADEFLDGEPE